MHAPAYWDERYRTGGARWDLGSPTPVIEQLLAEGRIRPGRTLVLGCGTGHDAILLARAGCDVTAVDFSEEALIVARTAAALAGVTVTFLCRDLFTLAPEYDEAFDCVIEYVTYCAVEPSRRAAFAATVSSVLRPGGMFIGLFFPIEVRSDGPPFGVSMAEVRTLFGARLRLVATEEHPKTIAPRKGRELLTCWRKPGRGLSDGVSE